MRTAYALLLALGSASACLAQDKPKPAEPVPAPQADLINPDRPGIADGSYVIGPRRYQIETGVQYETHDAGGMYDRRIFVPALLRVGISDKWEGRIETFGAYSWARVSDSASSATASGYSPVSIGAKYHWQDSKGIGHPSLGAIARVFPIMGSGGFQSGHTQADFRLAVDWDISEKWEMNPNIGIGAYEDSNGNAFTAGLFAWTINYNLTSKTQLFVDTGVTAPEERHGQNSIVLDAGGAWILGQNLALDLSVGTAVSGQTGQRPFVAAGISIRY